MTLVRPETPPAGEVLEAFAVLLEQLMPPLQGSSLNQVAGRLLEFSLAHCGRNGGWLGVFDAMGRLTVLASRGGEPAPLPESASLRARKRPDPFTLEADGAQPALVIPLGPEPRGLMLVVGATAKGTMIRVGRALGELVRTRLSESMARGYLQEEIRRLRFQRAPGHVTVLASSRLMLARRHLRRCGLHDSPVLILGEDGTEKEDLAHYLHTQSNRNRGPFIPFHPAALPTHRIEEALLGSSDPGEGRDPSTALVRARGGTLYIEGPDLLPEQVQSRLQATLAAATPDGDDADLDVRFVASITARSIEESLGPLVPELAHLLAPNQVEIPPLRGHLEDIGALAELVLSEMGPGPGGRPRLLTRMAKRRLLDYWWPGNLRQLRTVLEVAAGRAGTEEIAERHLPVEVREAGSGIDASGLDRLVDVEKQHIQRVLHAVGGRRSRAAAVLGIATSTLYEKLKRYDLED